MKLWVSLVVVAGFAAACESEPTGTADPGQLVASINGGFESRYEGSGQFTFRENPQLPHRPAVFTLRSRGSTRGETFYLYRLGGELPQPGTYPLARNGGFGATYERVRDGKRELFRALDGEVVIRTATADRVEGSFRLTAVLGCTGVRTAMKCSVPIPPDAPRIEVTGSFAAVPAR